MANPVPENNTTSETSAASAVAPVGATSVRRDRAAPPPAIPDHELIRRIGAGSYGEVWLSRNIMGGFRAVKIIYRDAFQSARPFEREFRGIQNFEPLSRLQENQVDILHVGRADDYFYYVMELADDQAGNPAIDSDHYSPKTLKSEQQRLGRLPVQSCLELGVALTAALAHLHQRGLTHRDVKPSNIIYVNAVPKLADIGLVTGMDATVSFVGTEGFIAPRDLARRRATSIVWARFSTRSARAKTGRIIPSRRRCWETFLIGRNCWNWGRLSRRRARQSLRTVMPAPKRCRRTCSCSRRANPCAIRGNWSVVSG